MPILQKDKAWSQNGARINTRPVTRALYSRFSLNGICNNPHTGLALTT